MAKLCGQSVSIEKRERGKERKQKTNMMRSYEIPVVWHFRTH